MNDQRSLQDQLQSLLQLANQNGLYDAADWLSRQIPCLPKETKRLPKGTKIGEIKAGREEGKRTARYFGKECQANAADRFEDFLDDIALYYGYKSWDRLPKELKDEATAEFKEGERQEREAQKAYRRR